jgi:hypothetical protein
MDSDEYGDDWAPIDAQPQVQASPFGVAWRNVAQLANPNTSGDEYIPTTSAEVIFLTNLLEEHRSEHMVQYMGQLRTKAQATSARSRTEAQTYMCRRWRRPTWVSTVVINSEGRPVRTTVAKARPPHAGPIPDVEYARIAHELGLVQNGQPNPTLGNVTSPNDSAHPAIWQGYIRNYLRNQQLPWGLSRPSPEAPVPEPLLRAMLRLRGMLATATTSFQYDLHGSEARIIAYLILAQPGRYRELVEKHNLTINFAGFQPAAHQQTPSEEAVASHLALRGLTFAEADDAMEFARRWIEDASLSPNHPDEIRRLLRHANEVMQASPIRPPNGRGGLPNHVPVIWNSFQRRWISNPSVIATANEAYQTASSAVPTDLMGDSTMGSVGGAGPETITNVTTPEQPDTAPVHVPTL